ncbi:MAG: SDR family NAD(P)-dependent oxidoreductase [Gammaproteobacteria bacterium]|nr:SDR family NAD(P)-dependent oxidoreductase [Gammaproteobacteria bacterium]
MKVTRTALVTGASAGLGKAFANELGSLGTNLVLVARRLEKLETVACELRERHSVLVSCIPADLADPEAPLRIFEATQNQGLIIDYLINNAGSGGPDLLNTRDWSELRAYLELMMISAAQMCHLFVPGMKDRGWGRVINVSSVSARIPRAGGCNYGPSKAYLVALSEELSLTLGKRGIKVCALCPGFTHTDFHDEGELKSMKENSPSILWYEAETVVREGLAALERGKSVYVSGRLYRWLDPFFQSVWTRRLFKISAAQ